MHEQHGRTRPLPARWTPRGMHACMHACMQGSEATPVPSLLDECRLACMHAWMCACMHAKAARQRLSLDLLDGYRSACIYCMHARATRQRLSLGLLTRHRLTAWMHSRTTRQRLSLGLLNAHRLTAWMHARAARSYLSLGLLDVHRGCTVDNADHKAQRKTDVLHGWSVGVCAGHLRQSWVQAC
eukprot:364786-Chlamydomonas_euryale.AAC.28